MLSTPYMQEVHACDEHGVKLIKYTVTFKIFSENIIIIYNKI